MAGSQRETPPMARRGAERIGLAALLVSLAVLGTWGLSVRMPESADLGWQLAVNGPRLLLAAAVGLGLAVSGVVGEATRPGSLREPLTLAVSCGAASGAVRGLGAGLLGPGADLALGAALGAVLYAGVIALLARTRHLAGGLVGIAMVAMVVSAALAAVSAKGDPLGARPLVWWMLGDFSRAGWWSASLAAAAVLALALLLVGRTTPGPWAAQAPAGRRALVLLASGLWGIAIGAGGIIAWFGTLVALAARRLPGGDELRSWLLCAGLLGALLMVGLDAGTRALVGGYAFPIGIAVAMVAVPWFLGWGYRPTRPSSRPAAVLVRSVDLVLAAGVALGVAGFLVVLTLVVGALG